MAYTDLLINWVAGYRLTPGTPDAYGQPTVGESWDVIVGLNDVPCRLMATKGIEVKVGAEVVIADYKLFLPARPDDENFTEQDRAYVWVRDAADAWIAIWYEGLLVKNIQDGVLGHQMECLLRTVR